MKFVVFIVLLCVVSGQELRRTHERGAPKATKVPSPNSCSNNNHCPPKYSCERISTFEMKCIPVVQMVSPQPDMQIAPTLMDRGIPYIRPSLLPVISGPAIPYGLLSEWKAGGNALPYGFAYPYQSSTVPVAPSVPDTSTASTPPSAITVPYAPAAFPFNPSFVPYTPAPFPFNPSFVPYNRSFAPVSSTAASPALYVRPTLPSYSAPSLAQAPVFPAPLQFASPVLSTASFPPFAATLPALSTASDGKPSVVTALAAPLYTSVARPPVYTSTLAAPAVSAPLYTSSLVARPPVYSSTFAAPAVSAPVYSTPAVSAPLSAPAYTASAPLPTSTVSSFTSRNIVAEALAQRARITG